MADLQDKSMKEIKELGLFFDLVPDMLCIASAEDGYFKELNAAWEKTLGFTIEELLSKPLFEFIHPDDRASTMLEVEKQLKGQTTIFFNNRYICKDGSYRWFSWTSTQAKGNLLYATARDITEYKKVEDKMLRQQYYLEKAQEIGAIGTWELDIIKNKLIWTDQNYLNFGVPIGTPLTYEIFLNCVHPDDREYVNAEWIAAISGKPYDIEHRLIIDGKIRWVREKADLTFDKEGNAISAIGFTQDITERKRTMKLIERSENKYRTLLKNIPQKIFYKDINLDYILCNESYAKDLNIEPSEIIGKSDYDFYSKELADKYRNDDKKIMDSGKIFESEEKYVVDGKEMTVNTIKAPILDEIGETVGIFGMFWDITERKNVEDQLKEREQHLQSIINTEPECVKIVSSDGTLLQMNPAGLKMIEADSIEQVIGKSVYPIIASKDQDAFRELTESVCLGNQGSLEFEIIGLKGTHRWLETHAVSLRDAQNEIIGLLGVTRDITEHKKALEEIMQLNKDLEQILYVTSHDLRSPLVNVDGYSKELDYSLKELMSFIEKVDVPLSIKEKITPIVKKDIPESLHYIQTSVKKMNALLKGILILSRLGRNELEIKEIDMNEMMSDIVDNHRFRLKEFNTKTEVLKLPNCKGDSSQINQVFSNLLDNAIKYTDSERSGVINISGYKDKNQSVFCIEDNGIGIATEHQDKIFEIFHQLEPNRVKGEGMGLTIAHRIIEKHKGKIWVESEWGKGSKFFVSLPS